MDYKKSKAPVNTVTRNIMDLCENTDNIYESVVIISKRANQISAEIKQDLNKKLAEFAFIPIPLGSKCPMGTHIQTTDRMIAIKINRVCLRCNIIPILVRPL